jgi:hypothetical protein
VTAKYIRDTYGVPAKRGIRVMADGQPGTIVGFAGAHLRIRLDGARRATTWHPTWRIEYPSETSGPRHARPSDFGEGT